MDYHVSIIIPHYNSMQMLKKLLSTIPGKADIQVIVIDDHSPDPVRKEYIQLSKEYQSSNYLFLENQTEVHNAGAARNIGLNYVKGDWVLFADADDYFVDGFYEKVKSFFDSDYDIVYFTPTSILSDTGETGIRHLTQKWYIDEFLANPSRKNELMMRTRIFTPWSKLIRSGLIKENKLEFDEISVSNDQFFSVKAGFYAKKIAASKEIIYCTTRNSGSLTTRTDLETFDLRANTDIKVYNFLKSNMNHSDFRMIQKPVAYEYMLKIVQRHYGRTIFLKYYRLFHQNQMFTFNFRWFGTTSIQRAIRVWRDEKGIQKNYQKKACT